MTIPSGATTWQSDPNWSPTSPTRSKITPAKVTPSQSGLHREATRAPPSSAKSQCGGPPTASIPKTRDQPEETQLETLPALWKQRLDRDIARATYPPADARADERQAGRTALSRRTTTGSARTKNPNGVRAGRPRPADSTPQSSDRGARNMRLHSTRRWQDRQHTAESGSLSDQGPGCAPAGGACPRCAAGRAT